MGLSAAAPGQPAPPLPPDAPPADTAAPGDPAQPANPAQPAPPPTYPPQPGAYPPGAYPPGAYPPGAYPPGAYPPGAYPPGAYPPGAYPPGAYPPGAYPPAPGYGYPPYGYGYPPPPPPPAKDETPKNDEARADDSVAINGGVYLYNVLGIGMGAQLGVYASPSTLIEADVLSGVAVFPDAPQSNSFSLGIRQFVSPSFNVRAALRYRKLRTEKWFWDFDETYDEYLEQWDVGFDIALGNRWQIGSFTIGADWFGIYSPLVTLDAEAVVENQHTGAEVQREDIDKDEVDQHYDIRLAFLQLGGSF